jgi:hypothetical protein
MGLYGAPKFAIMYVAFAGAVILIVSALIAAFSRNRFVWPATAGLILLWLFYAPALVVTLRASRRSDFGYKFLSYCPSLLLMIATVFLVIGNADQFNVRHHEMFLLAGG